MKARVHPLTYSKWSHLCSYCGWAVQGIAWCPNSVQRYNKCITVTSAAKLSETERSTCQSQCESAHTAQSETLINLYKRPVTELGNIMVWVKRAIKVRAQCQLEKRNEKLTDIFMPPCVTAGDGSIMFLDGLSLTLRDCLFLAEMTT